MNPDRESSRKREHVLAGASGPMARFFKGTIERPSTLRCLPENALGLVGAILGHCCWSLLDAIGAPLIGMPCCRANNA